MRKYPNATLLLILVLPGILQAQQLTFENGNWYVNGKFKKTDVYSVNGVFSFTRPGNIDSTINLQ